MIQASLSCPCPILVSTPRNHFVVLRVCSTTTVFFLYSESLQPRRSFFATLHPLLRAPLPSFTSLFRHYEQFVVCPPLPSPSPPLPAAEFYFALVCRLLLPRRTLPFISVHGLSLRAILFRRGRKGSKNQRAHTYLCITPFFIPILREIKLNRRLILDPFTIN